MYGSPSCSLLQDRSATAARANAKILLVSMVVTVIMIVTMAVVVTMLSLVAMIMSTVAASLNNACHWVAKLLDSSLESLL